MRDAASPPVESGASASALPAEIAPESRLTGIIEVPGRQQGDAGARGDQLEPMADWGLKVESSAAAAGEAPSKLALTVMETAMKNAEAASSAPATEKA